jgi:hypothetical protein
MVNKDADTFRAATLAHDGRGKRVTTQANRWSPKYRCVAGRLSQSFLIVVMSGLAASTVSDVAEADNFANVYYDAKTDELVVTMRYRGTNPDHTFSLQWGKCQTLADASVPEIVADVNDSQARDAAREDFKTTTRFSLQDLPCRPAKLTLRTAPRFYYTLQIPAGTTRPQ